MRSTRTRNARAYLLATLVFIIALGVRWLAAPLIGNIAPYSPFFVAVIICSALWGFGPGLCATALGSIAGAMMLGPGSSWILRILVFVQAVFVSWLIDRFRATRHKAESYAREIRTSHARISEILTSITDAFLVLDRRWRITDLNPRAETLLGRTRSEVLGQDFWVAFPQVRSSVFQTKYSEAIETGKPVHFEAKADDARDHWLEAHAYPGTDDLTIYFRDITDRKRVESELSQARDAAEAASRAKTTFLANMSHEMRTPLGAILGFADLLDEGKPRPDEQQEWTRAIQRNGLQLKELIDEILDLSRIEAGRLDLVNVPFSLADLVGDVLESLGPEARRKRIALELGGQEGIPALLLSDPGRLRQILTNIIGNAVKFTDAGGVEVRARALSSAWSAQVRCEISVRDTGPGLSAAQQERLFQPFSQADASMTRRFGGSGLGLALSRRLARALGGDVVIGESTPGVGSTFIITIVAKVERVTHGRAVGASSRRGPSAPTPRLEGMSILLVEDSPDLQLYTKRVLTNAGARVEVADNGRIATERAMDGHFDVVLMDIQMPELDGNAATQQLRRHGYRKPIIALTAHAMNEEREALANGFDDFLTKPIDYRKLLGRLARFATAAREVLV